MTPDYAGEILYKNHARNKGCTIFDPLAIVSLIGVSQAIKEIPHLSGGLTGGMGIQAEIVTSTPREEHEQYGELFRETNDLDILAYTLQETLSLKTFEREVYPAIDERIRAQAEKHGMSVETTRPKKRKGFLEITVERKDGNNCDGLYLHFKRPTKGMDQELRELYKREARNAVTRRFPGTNEEVILLRLEDTIVPKAYRWETKDRLDLMMLAVHHPDPRIDREYLGGTIEYYARTPRERKEILQRLEIVGLV